MRGRIRVHYYYVTPRSILGKARLQRPTPVRFRYTTIYLPKEEDKINVDEVTAGAQTTTATRYTRRVKSPTHTVHRGHTATEWPRNQPTTTRRAQRQQHPSHCRPGHGLASFARPGGGSPRMTTVFGWGARPHLVNLTHCTLYTHAYYRSRLWACIGEHVD